MLYIVKSMDLRTREYVIEELNFSIRKIDLQNILIGKILQACD